MTRTSAAISEITRVAWWGLRALGCPLGAVERMAKVLAFSEVLEGNCLAALRGREALLTASFKADEPQFQRLDAGYGVVDAAGRSFLDVGPRTVDVLTGIARAGTTVRMRVCGAADRLGWSGSCVLAAMRGVSVLGLRPANDGSARLEWALYVAGPTGIRRVGGVADGEAALRHALQRFVREGASFPAIPEALPRGEGRECGHAVDLIGFAPARMPELALDGHPDAPVADIGAALHDAYAHGIDVDAPDLKFLYELEMRTWAPSSERSRMQAGFAAPSPASAPTQPG